jgi:hypothetical protein
MGNDYPSTEEILASEASQPTQAPTQETAAPTQAVPEKQAPPQQAGPQFLDLEKYKTHHLTYKANGKEVKEPLEKILNRASQGYNYAQQMEQLKERGKQYDSYDEKLKALEKWKQFDDYAASNPEWAKHVEDTWRNRTQVANPNIDPADPVSQKLSHIEKLFEERFNQFGQKFSKYDEFINGQEAQKADKSLDEVIGSVRDEFKQIDFDQADDDGKTVEYKVLEHMKNASIRDFKTAFVSLYYNDLVSSAKSQALSQEVNERQKQAKQGIMGVSSTPKFSKPAEGFNVRGKTYEQLAEMAKEELRQHA